MTSSRTVSTMLCRRLYKRDLVRARSRHPQSLRSTTSSVVNRTVIDKLASPDIQVDVGPGVSSSSPQDFGNYRVILPPEPFVWGVSHIMPRTVPSHIRKPDYARGGSPGIAGCTEREGALADTVINNKEIDARISLGGVEEHRLRNAARLARAVREYARSLVQPGITTNAIDAAIHEYIISHSAYPSPLLYSGFPRSCCTSVNNILAHGIPDENSLESGDVINVDITVYLDGYHGDTSETFLVGDVDEQGRQLVDMANNALRVGILACGPGRPFRGIGRAIHDLVSRRGYSVSPLFIGHGIGTVFHKPPWIHHTHNEEPGAMLPGHCFTIEPCIIQGTNPTGWIFPDGWTASTENCARSAQAEHMILITETGVDVLT